MEEKTENILWLYNKIPDGGTFSASDVLNMIWRVSSEL